MSGAGTARAARAAVVGLGGAFMISPEAKAAGKDGGLRGRELYVVGRGGVLEDVSAARVVVAFGFWEPATVTAAWESGTAKAPVGDIVSRFTEVCRDWGRHRWADLAGVDRLAELLGAVSAATGTSAAGPEWALHAGWKARPLPDDAAARAAQLLHVLREHRGGAHQDAIRTVGLSPLEAVLAGPGGPGNAAFFGWQEPLPETTDDQRARWTRAEDLTDELAAPAYAVLGADEVTELGGLLAGAAAAAH